jgi:hypothetical protein
VRLNEIYQTYKDDMDFCCVYIKEAHPEDSVGGYRSERNTKDGIFIDQQTEIEDRAEAAEVCVLRLNLEMPMVLDDMTNQVEEAYIAWPDRMFVVDESGVIQYHSALGPHGFLPDEWEQAIKLQLVS